MGEDGVVETFSGIVVYSIDLTMNHSDRFSVSVTPYLSEVSSTNIQIQT